MKKKILTMLVLMVVLLPVLSLFASCNKNEPTKTVSNITLVRSTGEEVHMFEYTYGSVIEPLNGISLKVMYSDASTKTLDLTDSGIKMTYTYKPANGSDEERQELPALPAADSYQAGVYEMFITYGKQQIVVPIYVSQASAGGNFALRFKSTPQQSTTWDYANNPKLEEFINTLYVNGKTTYTPESTDIYYITLTEWQRVQQECVGVPSGGYSLPNTAQAQTLLNEAEKETLYNTLILPGDYVLIAKVSAEGNYSEQFTVHGLGLTITKTVLTETSKNIGRVIPLSYTTVDELTNGLQASLLEGGDYIANDASLCIQDAQGNVYETADFALGNTWVDLPNIVHYENAHLQTYQRSCVPSYAYIRKVDADMYADSYSVDGFDFSQLTVKVQLNITPVTLSVDISKTITCSVHEYLGHMQEYTATLNAQNAPEASLVQNLCTFSYTLNGEPVTYPTMVATSDNNQIYASVYMCIEEQSLATGEYTMRIASAYPNAVEIEGSNVACTITINPSTIVVDENSYIPQNTFTPSAEGNVTIKIPLKWKGTLYSDLLTDATLVNAESLKLSMASESAVTLGNATFTVSTEDGQVYIQCTAKVTAMTGAYGTASFNISGATNSSFYANIQIEANATVRKYTLQTTDYVQTTDGARLDNTIGSNNINITQMFGETFTFEEYLEQSTLTNVYGTWSIHTYDNGNPGVEVKLTQELEAPETNRLYILVFTPTNDMYCSAEEVQVLITSAAQA